MKKNKISIDDILRGYKKETKTAYEKGTFYLLMDIQQKNGEILLGKIMSIYKEELRRLYAFCFSYSEHLYVRLRTDSTIRFVCVLFVEVHRTLIPVFLMTFREPGKAYTFVIDDVCKKKNFKKRLFREALRFCFESHPLLSPQRARFYLALDIKNPYLCSAFCAYTKAGFVPYLVHTQDSKELLSMKYDRRSPHLV
jgi:hypothetical protein